MNTYGIKLSKPEQEFCRELMMAATPVVGGEHRLLNFIFTHTTEANYKFTQPVCRWLREYMLEGELGVIAEKKIGFLTTSAGSAVAGFCTSFMDVVVYYISKGVWENLKGTSCRIYVEYIPDETKEQDKFICNQNVEYPAADITLGHLALSPSVKKCFPVAGYQMFKNLKLHPVGYKSGPLWVIAVHKEVDGRVVGLL